MGGGKGGVASDEGGDVGVSDDSSVELVDTGEMGSMAGPL